MLIVTYDEHGGLYDHVTPPSGFPGAHKDGGSSLGELGPQSSYPRWLARESRITHERPHVHTEDDPGQLRRVGRGVDAPYRWSEQSPAPAGRRPTLHAVVAAGPGGSGRPIAGPFARANRRAELPRPGRASSASGRCSERGPPVPSGSDRAILTGGSWSCPSSPKEDGLRPLRDATRRQAITRRDRGRANGAALPRGHGPLPGGDQGGALAEVTPQPDEAARADYCSGCTW